MTAHYVRQISGSARSRKNLIKPSDCAATDWTPAIIAEQAQRVVVHRRGFGGRDEALQRLTGPGGVLDSVAELEAVGFKAVHARSISGVVELDDDVIERMISYYPLAPAHNPAYVAAIEQFAKVAPTAALVGCFESAFHGNMPLRRQLYR